MSPAKPAQRRASSRLEVTKTYKLFIGGAFPRSESGRTLAVESPAGKPLAHIAHASRKDLRDSVGAARKALPGWSGATAYLRGQILYRLAEMLEGKSDEFAGLLRSTQRITPAAAHKEVHTAIDRVVAFAGWADKFSQVLGCNNPVAGPYYNFTVPQATGVVAVVAPDQPPLLGLISLMAPALCAGNTVVAISGDSHAARLCAAVLAEACATSDVPAGVINLLTSVRSELIPWIAGHREIDGVHAAGLSADDGRALRAGAAENLKRVTVRILEPDAWFDDDCHSPWWIEPLVEMKTIWHPSAT